MTFSVRTFSGKEHTVEILEDVITGERAIGPTKSVRDHRLVLHVNSVEYVVEYKELDEMIVGDNFVTGPWGLSAVISPSNGATCKIESGGRFRTVKGHPEESAKAVGTAIAYMFGEGNW